MTTVFVDLPAARAAMKYVVEKYGENHKADYCVYVMTDGQPGCLVGEALLHLGVPREAFENINELTIDEIGSTLEYWNWAKFEEGVVQYLQIAQEAQDRLAPWGKALYMAESFAEHWVASKAEEAKAKEKVSA